MNRKIKGTRKDKGSEPNDTKEGSEYKTKT
jgi:hypothetical protein